MPSVSGPDHHRGDTFVATCNPSPQAAAEQAALALGRAGRPAVSRVLTLLLGAVVGSAAVMAQPTGHEVVNATPAPVRASVSIDAPGAGSGLPTPAERGAVPLPRSLRVAGSLLGMGPPRYALVLAQARLGSAEIRPEVDADAEAVAASLRRAGFVVLLRQDTGLAATQAALDEFSARLVPQAVGLIYFAGLGVTAEGSGWLLTRDTRWAAAERLAAATDSAGAAPAGLRGRALPVEHLAQALMPGTPIGLPPTGERLAGPAPVSPQAAAVDAAAPGRSATGPRVLIVDAAPLSDVARFAALVESSVTAERVSVLPALLPGLPVGVMALWSTAPVRAIPRQAVGPVSSTDVWPDAEASEPHPRDAAATALAQGLVDALWTRGAGATEVLRLAQMAVVQAGGQAPQLAGATPTDEDLAEPTLLDLLPRTRSELAREVAIRGLRQVVAREEAALTVVAGAGEVQALASDDALRLAAERGGRPMRGERPADGAAGRFARDPGAELSASQPADPAAGPEPAATDQQAGEAATSPSALGPGITAVAAVAGVVAAAASAAGTVQAVEAQAAALVTDAAVEAAQAVARPLASAATRAAGAAVGESAVVAGSAAAAGMVAQSVVSAAPTSAATAARSPPSAPSGAHAGLATPIASALSTDAVPPDPALSGRVSPAAAAAGAALLTAALTEAPRRNPLGYAEGDRFVWRHQDLWSGAAHTIEQRIDNVAPDGSLIGAGDGWRFDPEGRPQRAPARGGGLSLFEPAQTLWWASPRRGEQRRVRFQEHYLRADRSAGRVDYEGTGTVGRLRRVSVPAGEFEVLPIRFDGVLVDRPQRGSSRAGRWTATVWYAPTLAHPIRIDIIEHDLASRLQRRERMELTGVERALVVR